MDNDKYIGRLLDNRYEILEVIGSGGMAVVYKARCHRLNRLVAIKILRDDYLDDEDFRSRFHAESQAVAMFSHPNIVSVYDVSTSVSLEADYIVMELIDGISLKQYMEKKGVLNWKETLHFAMQIAKALEHAHSRGIVHRDIKPHNIMVLKNGSVKVADFGIARMMSKGNTLTKEALGSVHYISPEQAKGGRVDTRSDVYSLGVVMYEMMTGRPPYDGDSPVSVAIQHIDGGAPMPSTLNPSIPDGLEQIIMKAMDHNIDDRYESITKMLGDMEEFRKDPTMLFGYSAAALESLIQFPKKPSVTPVTNTTADRAVSRATGQKTGKSGKSQSAHRKQSPSRKPLQSMEEKTDKVSTIAIIVCSFLVVCGIAVILFFALVNPSGRTNYDGELIQVPNVAVMTSDQLKNLEDSEDFEVIWIEGYNETVEKGKVIRTEPEAGKAVAKGTKIQVYISLGPARTMLNMADLTKEETVQRLDSLEMDLNLVFQEEFSIDVAVGKVIRTDPKAGDPLSPRQTITIYLSKGSEAGVMPNLEEMDQDSAEELLKKQNLNLVIKVEEEFNSTIAAGKVLRTNPEKGTELKLNDEVVLYVSKGPEMKTMPWLTGVDINTAKNSLTSAGFMEPPSIVKVYSDKPEGTVIRQSVEAYTMADVKTVVVLDVSLGVLQKDVVITVPAGENDEPRKVEILRDGKVVWSEDQLSAEEKPVTLEKQEGLGKVIYVIKINDVNVKEEEVQF